MSQDIAPVPQRSEHPAPEAPDPADVLRFAAALGRLVGKHLAVVGPPEPGRGNDTPPPPAPRRSRRRRP
jgi:hypothetical protein